MTPETRQGSNESPRQTVCYLVPDRESLTVTQGEKEVARGSRFVVPSPPDSRSDRELNVQDLIYQDGNKQCYLVGATPEAARMLGIQPAKQNTPFSKTSYWHRTEIGSPEQDDLLERIQAGLQVVINRLGLLDEIQMKLEHLDMIEKRLRQREVLEERLAQLDGIEKKVDAAKNSLAQLEIGLTRELAHLVALGGQRGEPGNSGVEKTMKREGHAGLLGFLMGPGRRTGD